ncbi:ABC transporter substrate-binding protein [Cardiobacteriaceae bacterium TAE3-ERU3]|nr:ABC transporter substrate-binding protein [Cardiobacteriaceae bacterium TAE3-ERU3]
MNLKKTLTATACAALTITTSLTAAALDCEEGMRPFTHFAGETCIPEHPQRIVSMRGEQFTAPLYELGAPIIGSSGLQNDNINDGKPYPRGAYDLFDLTFEDSDIEYIGHPNQPDLEKIASLHPDLIFAPDWQSDLYEQLSQIAPTVIVDIWGNPMLDRYEIIADAAGKKDEFNKLKRRYDHKLERAKVVVADRFEDPSKVSVSLAQARKDKIHVYRIYAALSKAVEDLGFSTPELIANIEEGYLPVSPEKLPEIDADFMVGTYSLALNQKPSTIEADWESLIPGWQQQLHPTRSNQYIFIDREPMRALSFRAVEDTMAILLSNIAGRGYTPKEQSQNQ